ncbi:MAG: ShlB/FhaC/HecB family hemolysin secretion/activation protein [Bacteroidota bacterium]
MKIITTPYIYILFFFLQSWTIYTQNLTLIPNSKSPMNNAVFKDIIFQKDHTSESSIYKELDSITLQLQKLGFVHNKLDTFVKDDTIYYADYILGNQIKTIQIFYKGQIEKKYLEKYSDNVTDKFFEIPFYKISETLQFLANSLEEAGNSFSQVSLHNIKLQNSIAKADLLIERSKKRKIDKIIVKGYDNFPVSFIKYALDLKEGNTFNLETLKMTSTNLKNIPFVTEIKAPQVLFTNDSTYLYLYLQKQRSNTFDGLIGFSSKPEGSGLDFNGYLDVKLQNIFNRGEMISVFWKSNGSDSQQFDLTTQLPYIFNLPISPQVSLNIFRQDSTYSNVNFNAGIYFDIKKNSKIAALINSENSTNLQSADYLNNVVSFKKNNYGVNFLYRIPYDDDLFFNKFNIDLRAFYGIRNTEQNKTNQTKLEFIVNYLWRLNLKNYIFIQNQSSIINADNLYTNELFRIGGINTIRGFDEESIFASAYSILNIEYRYKTNLSAYFYTISDFAYVNDQINNQISNNFSLGLGYSFLTKMGRLNLSYAIGKFQDLPFNLNNSKLHIKINSFF